jgi:glucokinase
MNNQKLTVGVDIGGTNTVFGFVTETGECVFNNSIPTNPDEEVDKFIVRLSDKIKTDFKNYSPTSTISGIGIAAPMANYIDGTIESPSNIKWGKVNFVAKIKKYFSVPIAIINDANAAALGVNEYGLAKGLKNFIVITLGTGLGSGIVINGDLLYSEGGLTAEFGHVIINPNGRHCNCGRTGCLETYTSANGIRRTVIELMARSNEESELRNIPYSQISGQLINDLATKGDPLALQAFQYTGEILGIALANLAISFVPELIILFGGLADSDELILEPTRKYFEKNLLNIYKGKIKILKSSMDNGMSAILGASILISKEIKNLFLNNNVSNSKAKVI